MYYEITMNESLFPVLKRRTVFMQYLIYYS
jgi:hypothetical protein